MEVMQIIIFNILNLRVIKKDSNLDPPESNKEKSYGANEFPRRCHEVGPWEK
jgi:hypothetical protein